MFKGPFLGKKKLLLTASAPVHSAGLRWFKWFKGYYEQHVRKDAFFS